jgi:hypothetical protein
MWQSVLSTARAAAKSSGLLPCAAGILIFRAVADQDRNTPRLRLDAQGVQVELEPGMTVSLSC